MEPIFLQAFIGGLLIGLGAILLMWANGQIAGVSGILQGAFSSLAKNGMWRWAFIIGLIIAPILTQLLGYDLPVGITTSTPALLIAGVLVGIGTQIGSGCTSGHGICGIGRLSKRSIVATCTFMFSAICTVAIVRFWG